MIDTTMYRHSEMKTEAAKTTKHSECVKNAHDSRFVCKRECYHECFCWCFLDSAVNDAKVAENQPSLERSLNIPGQTLKIGGTLAINLLPSR